MFTAYVLEFETRDGPQQLRFGRILNAYFKQGELHRAGIASQLIREDYVLQRVPIGWLPGVRVTASQC